MDKINKRNLQLFFGDYIFCPLHPFAFFFRTGVISSSLVMTSLAVGLSRSKYSAPSRRHREAALGVLHQLLDLRQLLHHDGVVANEGPAFH